MPTRSSTETRPKKRRKTVEFVGGPDETLPLDDDKKTRPESTEDTVETESAEARLESHCLFISPISHSGPIDSPNMPHSYVLWVGNFVSSLFHIEPTTEDDLGARISTQRRRQFIYLKTRKKTITSI